MTVTREKATRKGSQTQSHIGVRGTSSARVPWVPNRGGPKSPNLRGVNTE